MSRKEIDASAALERILVTYGFKQQKDLAEHLGIHGNNVSSWLARNTIPSNVFLECALDTGADLYWLCYGELAKSSLDNDLTEVRGKDLYEEVLSAGGKQVLRRILDAYGFNTQKQLCDLLEISSGTVSTWVRRNYFPGDIVVTCALDTGVDLNWLATGHGKPAKPKRLSTITEIKTKRLTSGKLEDDTNVCLSDDLLPAGISNSSLLLIKNGNSTFLIDASLPTISNGKWLIDLDGSIDFYRVARRPGNQLSLISNCGSEFNCGVDDVTPLGIVVLTISY